MGEKIKNILTRENRKMNGEWITWDPQTFEEDFLGLYLRRLGNVTAAKDLALNPDSVRTNQKLHQLFLDTAIAEERMGLEFEKWVRPLVFDQMITDQEGLDLARATMLRDPEGWIHTWYENMVKLNIAEHIGDTA